MSVEGWRGGDNAVLVFHHHHIPLVPEHPHLLQHFPPQHSCMRASEFATFLTPFVHFHLFFPPTDIHAVISGLHDASQTRLRDGKIFRLSCWGNFYPAFSAACNVHACV